MMATVQYRGGQLLAALAVSLLLVLPGAAVPEDAAQPSRFGPYVGHDVIEVWVCAVPLDTRDRTYNPSPLRIAIEPDRVAAQLNEHVKRYFATLSNGGYAPQFAAGGVLHMQDSDGPQRCFARALDRSGSSATAVLAIADAEHRPDSHGGLGDPGARCVSTPTPCPARESRRGAYVGASDFHPDWGSLPALDLIEHELGHTMGWPHSGSGTATSYDSALDVMSDSTARRTVHAGEHHAGGTLGINLYDAGWIPHDDVVTVPRNGTTSSYTLRPSAAPTGLRLLKLPLGPGRFITVELLTPGGLDDHLPESGVALTLIDASPAACGTPCDLLRRRHTALGAPPPYTDLRQPADGPWSGDGWKVEVRHLGDRSTVVEVTSRAG